MAAGRAWVLNLDADLELATAGPYSPRKAVRTAMEPHVARLAASLLAPGDVLVDDASPPLSARGLPGRAFCPTPRALATLRRAGADPEAHPAVEILRRVNSRAFASSLGATLPGAAFVTDLETARAMLGAAPAVGEAWRVKHAFGMAGRNQRVIAPAALHGADLAFVERALAAGGAQIEPEVPIVEEYAVHGVVGPSGECRFGAVARQVCDEHGAWLATEPMAQGDALIAGAEAQLGEEARRVARALRAEGYFGPFGVDGYAYRDREGGVRLQVRGEINARYSMGFPRGL